MIHEQIKYYPNTIFKNIKMDFISQNMEIQSSVSGDRKVLEIDKDDGLQYCIYFVPVNSSLITKW